MTAFHEPLELQYWFVNVFSGNWTIFIFVSMFAISAICAMFRMPNSTYIIMLLLFAGILITSGQQILFIILALILSLIFFWLVRRLAD